MEPTEEEENIKENESLSEPLAFGHKEREYLLSPVS
jgi:hypothetical protein